VNRRCCYCGGPGADLKIAPYRRKRQLPRRDAHQACFNAADDADQALTFALMAAPPVELREPAERRVRQPLEDLTGRVFGDLTVLHSVEMVRGRKVRTYWVCRCAPCGRSLPFLPESLRHGTQRCKPCATAQANRAGALRGVAAQRIGNPRRAA
jgi:hypothetical protein